MKRLDRRPLLLNTAVGVLLTLVVIAADWQGRDGPLAPLERRLFDLRARQCQFFTPPPTDKLVHLDIDDASLQAIGSWPWRRSLLADITDEIHRAGAKAVAFDVLFAEAQEAKHVPVETAPMDDVRSVSPRSLVQGSFERIDEDERFAAALRRFGNAMLPAAFEPLPPPTSLRQIVRRALFENLSLSETQVAQQLVAQGVRWSDPVELANAYSEGLADALYDRIADAMEDIGRRQGADQGGRPSGQPNSDPVHTQRSSEIDFAGVPSIGVIRTILFQGMEHSTYAHIPSGIFNRQYLKAAGFHRLGRLARSATSGLTSGMPVYGTDSPLPQFADAIHSASFVSYLGDADGTVRVVPMWQEHDGRLYPQFGLMLACMMLDVDIHAIEFAGDQMVIPAPDGPIVVPVFDLNVPSVGRRCGMFTYVPTFGGSGRNAWLTMYDHPRHLEPRQHLPIVKLWEIADIRRQIRANTERMDDALKRVYYFVDSEVTDRLDKKPIPPEELAPRVALIDALFKNLDDLDGKTAGARTMSRAELDKAIAEQPDDDTREAVRRLHAALQVLPVLRTETLRLEGILQQRRKERAAELSGKAVIIGWTAAGRIDIVNTSLQPNCPGPVVHGMIFNAIMTGDFWRQGSPWATRGLTLLIGVLATLIVVRTGPAQALLIALLLAAAYGAVNGIYFFDYHNLVLGAAAPLTAIALVWAGCTLTRTIIERAERKHIESRFRSYADPALVNYIVEHRDSVKLDGQVREMTVVFTDLAGFTTLNETLQEKTVGILNEYLGRMVPIIKDPAVPLHRQGYVNKFLGDGIMFFFNAPVDNGFHAADAVATVLKMQRSVVEFNDWLKAQGLPAVKMRAGICTGDMVVGNAGTVDRADYTVLGDNVNLASRLEGANKATGTLVLIHERTADLSRELILSRPIARLQVVGKTKGVMTYEPLCYWEEATESHRTLARLTEVMVSAFTAGQFEMCLQHVAAMEAAFGAGTLTKLYRAECEANLAAPPGAAFEGNIRLSEK